MCCLIVMDLQSLASVIVMLLKYLLKLIYMWRYLLSYLKYLPVCVKQFLEIFHVKQACA